MRLLEWCNMRRKSALRFVWASGMALIFVLLLLRLYRYGVSVANEERCSSQIHELGLGLLAYHEQYGRFPAPTLFGEEGQPLLSWRAVVLPYINWATDFSKLRSRPAMERTEQHQGFTGRIQLFRLPQPQRPRPINRDKLRAHNGSRHVF